MKYYNLPRYIYIFIHVFTCCFSIRSTSFTQGQCIHLSMKLLSNGNCRILKWVLLYHLKPYFVGIFPYIVLKKRSYMNGRYLQCTWNGHQINKKLHFFWRMKEKMPWIFYLDIFSSNPEVNGFHVAILAQRSNAWPSTLKLAELWREKAVETTAVTWWKKLSQRIHVWNIYLHWDYFKLL